MKKLTMLIAVLAFSVTCSFAQNEKSGVTVTKNSAGDWTFVDCDGNGGVPTVALLQSTLVTKEDGSRTFHATYDASAWCPPKNATKYTYTIGGWDSFIGIHTPGGQWIVKAKKKKD